MRNIIRNVTIVLVIGFVIFVTINYLTFPHWREKLSRIEDQEKFFEFDSGLFLSVDFVEGEKIPYYDENYEVHYKQTLRERKEARELARPDLYVKTTKNQLIELFC